VRPTFRRHLCLLVLSCSGLLTGCSYFGYYKYERPVWAPPTQSAQVSFPDSHDGAIQLTGDMLKALEVAMSDFLPPGTNPEKEKDPVIQCLSRRETYRATVQQVSDNLFFVSFFADLSHCAPGAIVLDAGADYAVDGQGRILARR
jgi:hypothetical protein